MKGQTSFQARFLIVIILGSAPVLFTGCQPPAGNGNLMANRSNTNTSSLAVNSNTANPVTGPNTVDAREPEQYQAAVKLKFEATGDQRSAPMPAIGAIVARKGTDRRMVFNLPTGEKIVYLDKGDLHYVVLPDRKQYAELNKDAVGFEVRNMLMPEQIANQIKTIKGVEKVGEENLNGRAVIKYSYGATADTKTKAGTVETESYIIIDKETGLPLHSETFSQSQGGADVQGYKGLRFVTEMSDIKTDVEPSLFEVPAGFQKVDPEQVKTQAKMIFDAAMLIIGQALKQVQAAPTAPQAAN